MSEYNFWADLLDTWQASSDWIKALTILTPPASLLGLIALQFWYRIRLKGSALGAIHRQPSIMPTEGHLLDMLVELRACLEGARSATYPDAFLPTPPAKRSEDEQSGRISRLRRVVLAEYHRGSTPDQALQRAREAIQDKDAE